MVILFGAGQVAEKLINDGLKPGYILDNNPELNNSFYHGIKIFLPTIDKVNSTSKIIICTTSISEVEKQLISLNFQGLVEIAKPLNEHKLVADLINLKLTCFISSGLPSISSSKGGGIYKIIEDENVIVEKIFSGNTHGMIKFEDGLAFTSQGDGIVILNNKNKVAKTIALPDGLRPHGLRFHRDLFYIACSSADKILVVDLDGKIKNSFNISNSKDAYGSAQHHCNDLYIEGNYLFLSMFSISGNWKRGIFDGGIIQLDLLSGQQKILCNHLKMPHSIFMFNGNLHILNSYAGEVMGYDFQPLGSLTGFVRGFDIKDNFMYVGESRNRNFSKLNQKSSFASIDSRVTIINYQKGLSRSVQLPLDISEIHSLVIL
jgi:hypothetical protein